MTDKKRNPFANPDGSPKEGKENDFYDFARAQTPENRNEIPLSDEEIIVEAEKALGERMDSDPEEG
ncbi:MAG: hypothetical protein ABI687_00970 [Flavitalea sp.]